MKQGLSIFAVSFLISTAALAEYQTDPRAAKGDCFFEGQRILMEKTMNADGWHAQLKPGLNAVVSFSAGYGMTFVNLSIERGNQTESKSSMLIAGEIKADSTKPTIANTMEHFHALSLDMVAPEGKICCKYNFYVARSFQGDPSNACH